MEKAKQSLGPSMTVMQYIQCYVRGTCYKTVGGKEEGVTRGALQREFGREGAMGASLAGQVDQGDEDWGRAFQVERATNKGAEVDMLATRLSTRCSKT